MHCTIPIAFIILLTYNIVSAGWKVVNGTRAIIYEYPQMVSIRIRSEHRCGGTLLNKNTVLTAAHCVWSSRNKSRQFLERKHIQVILGEYDLYEIYGDEQIFQVIRVIIHESFDKDNPHRYGNDVALLKFKGSIKHNQFNHIKYALLDKESMFKPGDHCEVVGWGSKSLSGNGISRFLQKAPIDIISNRECFTTFTNIQYTNTNICAGSGRWSTSPCNGDSGGPLFCKDLYNRRVQVGIVSYGPHGCGKPNVPTVFTRVSEVINWITWNS